MRQLKRLMCLWGVVLLLTLCGCQGAPGAESVQVSPAPSQGVEETVAPSQSLAPQPEESQAQPQQTQTPSQNQGQKEETVVSTPAPTTKPAPTAKPTPAPTPQPTPKTKTCYISIECKTILSRMEDLTPGKEGLVPKDGVILSRRAISFQEGETVFDVLCRATQQYGIHMEYEYTPGFGSHYIEGINNLYEFDCGVGSGWMYFVNGYKPNYGVSKYTLKDGDVIAFKYTCDLGYDL